MGTYQNVILTMISTIVVQNGVIVETLLSIVIVQSVWIIESIILWISHRKSKVFIVILWFPEQNYLFYFWKFDQTKVLLSLEKKGPIDENQAYRNDGRCGSEFKAPNGDIAECNPVGEYFCCSKWGFCGMTEEHCNCPECIDYRKPDAKS